VLSPDSSSPSDPVIPFPVQLTPGQLILAAEAQAETEQELRKIIRQFAVILDVIVEDNPNDGRWLDLARIMF
jgi:hypothetical protein